MPRRFLPTARIAATVLALAGCGVDTVPTGAPAGAPAVDPAEAGPAVPMPAGRDMGASWRAWDAYCADPDAACAVAPATIALTPSVWSLLEGVQRRVNAGHPYIPEPLGADAWRTLAPGEPGDCEDLALTKRARLIEAGLPAGALRPATCRLRGTPFGPGDGHAVLTVETTAGTLVLGVTGAPVPWDVSECDSWGYRWAGPTWVAVER